MTQQRVSAEIRQADAEQAARQRSSSDSVNTCRTRRSRPAPSDTRTAISRCLAAPRASSMLATLVHAISRSRPTTAISTSSGAPK